MKLYSYRNSFSKKSILGHVHIEKTGGTTLNQILRKIFALQFSPAINFSHQHPEKFRSEDLKILLRINPRIRCIAGHLLRPYIDLSKVANVKYITVLRNPIDRYISHHLFWLERSGWNHTFEHFLRREDIFNFQTKKIAGKEDLSLAKKILREKFIWVGLLDEFDDSLLLLRKRLQVNQNLVSKYKIHNIGKKDSLRKRAILDNMEYYQEKIIQRNQLDIELYEYVRNELSLIHMQEYSNYRDDQAFRLRKTKTSFAPEVLYYLEKIFARLYYVPLTKIIKGIMRRCKY